MRKILTALFALALLLGACTDESSTSAGDDESTEDTGTDEGANEDSGEEDGDGGEEGEDSDEDGSDDASDADDQARVDAALTAVEAQAKADGFTVTLEDPSDDDEDDDLEFESEECQEADRIFNDLEDEIGETAASQALDGQRGDFTSEDSMVEQVSLEITSTPSTDDVALGFDALESIDVSTCIAEAFEAASAEDGVTAENVEASTSSAGRGDRDIVISVQADFSSQGVSFPVDIVFTLIAVDRDVVFASALTFNGAAADDTLALFDLAVDELG